MPDVHNVKDLTPFLCTQLNSLFSHVSPVGLITAVCHSAKLELDYPKFHLLSCPQFLTSHGCSDLCTGFLWLPASNSRRRILIRALQPFPLTLLFQQPAAGGPCTMQQKITDNLFSSVIHHELMNYPILHTAALGLR